MRCDSRVGFWGGWRRVGTPCSPELRSRRDGCHRNPHMLTSMQIVGRSFQFRILRGWAQSIIDYLGSRVRGMVLSLSPLRGLSTHWSIVLLVLVDPRVLIGMKFRSHAWRGGLCLPPVYRVISWFVSFLGVGCVDKMGEWDFSGWGEFS